MFVGISHLKMMKKQKKIKRWTSCLEEQAKIPSVLLLHCIHIHHQSVVLLDQLTTEIDRF
jgi:hypothetical protein